MTLRVRILAACGLTLFGGALQAADLLSVYERALQNDPLIREADANRLASRESKPQALAALLPQLNANGSYSDVDQGFSRTTLTPSVPSDPNSDLVPRDINTDSDFKSRLYEITLRQTLFRWDQWVALRRADAEVAQAEADYQAAQQDLILRTSQRYFDVLAAQDTVDAAQATLEAFSRQLEQADKRFEVGLIAITDVQEARAAHDQAAAAVIQAKRALATANELLRELTGEPFSTLAGPIDDLPLEAPSPVDEEQWVTSALDQNLRVISARLATDIAKRTSRRARRSPAEFRYRREPRRPGLRRRPGEPQRQRHAHRQSGGPDADDRLDRCPGHGSNLLGRRDFLACASARVLAPRRA